MRIGVFGGTFDPVHESHIQMGLDALEQCHLDKVFFVPTRPWQKTARASEEDLSLIHISEPTRPY